MRRKLARNNFVPIGRGGVATRRSAHGSFRWPRGGGARPNVAEGARAQARIFRHASRNAIETFDDSLAKSGAARTADEASAALFLAEV